MGNCMGLILLFSLRPSPRHLIDVSDDGIVRIDGDVLDRDQTKSQQESPTIADGASTRNDASAYLRVAHIYMLISMPTGTSKIFGAFQAIWALPFFETGRKIRP